MTTHSLPPSIPHSHHCQNGEEGVEKTDGDLDPGLIQGYQISAEYADETARTGSQCIARDRLQRSEGAVRKSPYVAGDW